MKVKGTFADLQVTSTTDLREKKIKFNFLTLSPMEVHEVHLSKEHAQMGYESYFRQLEGKEIELSLTLRNIKFQPDPTKPMVDMTRFQLFVLPKELEDIIAAETKKAAVKVA